MDNKEFNIISRDYIKNSSTRTISISSYKNLEKHLKINFNFNKAQYFSLKYLGKYTK